MSHGTCEWVIGNTNESWHIFHTQGRYLCLLYEHTDICGIRHEWVMAHTNALWHMFDVYRDCSWLLSGQVTQTQTSPRRHVITHSHVHISSISVWRIQRVFVPPDRATTCILVSLEHEINESCECACVRVYVCVCINVCVCMSMCVCICTCMCMRISVCVYLCVEIKKSYTHKYTYKR